MAKDAKKIAELNDDFRKHFHNGTVVLTSGVSHLHEIIKARVLAKVQEFNEFDKDNDPYGEHDFGKLDFAGRTFFWKIDYYDLKMEAGSEDPADSSITKRVLTLMFAEEY